MSLKTCTRKNPCNNGVCATCYKRSFASCEKSKYWDYVLNGDIKPRQVYTSHVNYWFMCDICNHKFSASTSNVKKGKWCPYCANPPKKLCNDSNCIACFNKSFASHAKALFWNYKKNKCTPRLCFKSSMMKCWFTCDCKHDFYSKLANIYIGKWCPYCANPPKKLCDNLDCNTCLNKSFASHRKALFWDHKKNKCSPRQCFKNSNTKYYFSCDICDHEFENTLANINNLNQWCPYCAKQKLCDNNTCIPCYNNSFISHEKVQYWNIEKNNTVQPRQCFKASTCCKYWFTCKTCLHSFQSTLYNVSKGYWCPYCSSPPQKLCDNLDCSTCFKNHLLQLKNHCFGTMRKMIVFQEIYF